MTFLTNSQYRVSLGLTDFQCEKANSEIRWWLKCCRAQLTANAASKHSVNTTHDPNRLLSYSLCSNCLFFDYLLLDNLFFDCFLLTACCLTVLPLCLLSPIVCFLTACFRWLTGDSLWQVVCSQAACFHWLPEPSACLFFLPGPSSVCQRLLTQLSAVCVGGLAPLTTSWSLISLSDALTLVLFSFIPPEPLHHFSPELLPHFLVVLWMVPSILHMLWTQNVPFVCVCMTSHGQKVKAEVEEMEPAADMCPVCPSVLLLLAPRTVRSQGKWSCCFGSPLGAFCPDSAPSRDIPERSCWRRPRREELGVWDIFHLSQPYLAWCWYASTT